jgi:hypothetical protein
MREPGLGQAFSLPFAGVSNPCQSSTKPVSERSEDATTLSPGRQPWGTAPPQLFPYAREARAPFRQPQNDLARLVLRVP